MWYNLDVNKLGVLLTPPFLRGSILLGFIEAIVEPLKDVHYNFVQNRDRNIYLLEHNGQVCYMEAALNDSFDRSQRRIRIVDGNKYQRQYIYTRAENKPKYLGKIYLHERSDYSDTGIDFIVEVPRDLQYNDYEMKALIDLYRLASKRYKIQTY